MISVLGAEKLSLVEIEAFLAASESVRFAGPRGLPGRTEIYGWVERLLCHHEYPLQGRRSKGLLRAYVEHMTGLSRAQSTRLWRLCWHRADRRQALPAASLPAPLYSGGHRAAGRSRRGARAAQRPGHAPYSQARVRGLRQG